ncbi:MAG: hypothetical protein RLZZ01_1238 [Actinomycetota bacterium]
MKRIIVLAAAAAAAATVTAGAAQATPSRPTTVLVEPGEINDGGMREFARFEGQYSWSADGMASPTGEGTFDIEYPSDSTVAAAYLVMASSLNITEDAPPDPPVTPAATLNGQIVEFTHRAYEETEGLNWSNRFADVTDIVDAFLAAETPGTIVTIPATHPTSTGFFGQPDITGMALTVFFEDPAAIAFTTVFYFGHARTAGDEFTISVNPIETIPAVAALSIGSGWSAQGGPYVDESSEGYTFIEIQTSSDTERTLLSGIAGGCDDHIAYPSCNPYITVGGVGDDTANPTGTWTNSRSDDELYNLSEFLEIGDTSLTVYARNPRGDDTVFQTVFGIPARPTVPLTFDANGGTGTMDDQYGYTTTPLEQNTFTRDGYVFAGWNTAADGSGTSYADLADYPFDGSGTLYAQWTPDPTATVPSTTTDPTAGVLPSTGGGSGIARLAGVLLLAGTALVGLRRRGVTTV